MRSRWLFAGLILLAVLTCVRLGFWQLGRHFTRRAANELAVVSRRTEFDYPGRAASAPRVTIVATGHFDFDHEFVLRGRSYNGLPGVEIATPFRIEGTDSAFIVVRGFVPAGDAITVDRAPLREEGVRTIRGVTFSILNDGVPVTHNGDTTWDRIPGKWLQSPGNFPYPVFANGVWQEKETGMAALPIRVGAPALTEGPHFSYALQWFAFAVIFGVGGIVYTLRKRDEGGGNAAP